VRTSRRRSHHRRRGTRLRLGRQEANLGAENVVAYNHNDHQADNYNHDTADNHDNHDNHDNVDNDHDNDNDSRAVGNRFASLGR